MDDTAAIIVGGVQTPLPRATAARRERFEMHNSECWRELAACKGSSMSLFFPADDDDTGAAKIICAGCVVRQCCLESALIHREATGVWGGLTAAERKQLLRRQRRSAGAVPA